MESMIVLLLFVLGCSLLVRHWSRIRGFSGASGKNEGRGLVLWCTKSEKEIIELLALKSEEDLLLYDFYEENGEYYLKAKGVRGIANVGSVPELYRLKFMTTDSGTDLTISTYWKGIYKTESELYEFFRRKLGCVLKENRR